MSDIRQRKQRQPEYSDISVKAPRNTEAQSSKLGPLRILIALLVLNFTLSFYITDSATWGVQTKWTNPRYLQFRFNCLKGKQEDCLHVFSEDELSKYNGQDPDLPIFLAISGKVYDVTSNPLTYGPGGPYSMFSGRDAARAFHTGCFQTDLTHDLRGLPEVEALEDIAGWQRFFENSHKYWHVGYVSHGPLTGDPPAPCENGFKLPDAVSKGTKGSVANKARKHNGETETPRKHLPKPPRLPHNVQHPHPNIHSSAQ